MRQPGQPNSLDDATSCSIGCCDGESRGDLFETAGVEIVLRPMVGKYEGANLRKKRSKMPYQIVGVCRLAKRGVASRQPTHLSPWPPEPIRRAGPNASG